MKFKILLLITFIIVILVGYFAFTAKKTSRLQTPISKNSTSTKKSPNKTTKKTKEYVDPAGFKFSYPDNLKVVVIDKKDPNYYSALQLKSPEFAGSITIEATSTKYKTLDEWAKNNKEITGNSKDIKLAELAASKITGEGTINIFAIDLETLFTLTADFPKDSEKYWKDATDKIVSTFAFEKPEISTESTSTESLGDDVVFEGEEVIE